MIEKEKCIITIDIPHSVEPIIVAILCVAPFVILIVLYLSSFHAQGKRYMARTVEIDNGKIYSSPFKKAAAYTAFVFDGYNTSISVPDDLEGKPITSLGGPYPFMIDNSQADNIPPEKPFAGMGFDHTVVEDYRLNPRDYDGERIFFEPIDFELYIGKNIEEIDAFCDDVTPHLNIDGSYTFYITRVYITCSSENQFFYSQKGKLYHKDGTPVDGFLYYDFDPARQEI